MKTIADEWIEEGMEKGIEKGRQEGSRIKQREIIVQIFQHRFAPTTNAVDQLTQELAQIEDDATLKRLIDSSLQAFTVQDFLFHVEQSLPVPDPAN